MLFRIVREECNVQDTFFFTLIIFFQIQECWFGVHNVWVRVKNIPKHIRADVAG